MKILPVDLDPERMITISRHPWRKRVKLQAMKTTSVVMKDFPPLALQRRVEEVVLVLR
jgi:hypothetical protein